MNAVATLSSPSPSPPPGARDCSDPLSLLEGEGWGEGGRVHTLLLDHMPVSLAEVERLSVTTVVDNFVDSLRADEKIATRFTHAQARRMPTLKAEHGLGHW